MSAALAAMIDGQAVPLSECDWVEWAPCGCIGGVAMAALGDYVLATESAVWKEFYETKPRIRKAQAQGFRLELVSHDRWRDELVSLFVACPHTPKWGLA